MAWQSRPAFSGRQVAPCPQWHAQRCPVHTDQRKASVYRLTTIISDVQHLAQPASSCHSEQIRHSVRVQAAAAPASAAPSLQAAEMYSVLNIQGLILPEVPESTEASVFAIFDGDRKLQFIGFSKDFRNTLRTLMGRRPEKTHFYKAHHLERMDQDAMVAVRTAWFEEIGGSPSGNKLPNERKMWQQPVEAGAISERGRLQAAENQVQEQLNGIKLRGCKEEFIPNPALLQNGQVDFLPSKAMTPEELQKQRELIESMAKATRTISTVVDGQQRTIEMYIKRAFKTNGGYMYDLTITYDEKETEHRVIVGKDYYEDNKIEPEQVLERVFAFLMRKRVPRHTEGMLLSSQFPVNYFGVSDVEQWFDDFADEFADTGKVLPGPGKFWRFNKLYNYKDQSSAIFREKTREIEEAEGIA